MVASSSGSGLAMTELSTPMEAPGLFRGYRRRMQEARDVLWYELKPQAYSDGIDPEEVQIFVEVPQPGRQRDRFNADGFRSLRENRLYGISGGIVIAGDIEPTQARRQQHGCEVIGRKRSRHGQGRQCVTQ
ncbi:protein of unknown function [Bradyrhizobium vignae]|uniref:Uncharacterized protein n=1 Tax=Bradyrhizobium vignae TaxID=1549949 RepID=A0A2U3PU39_9BRAD|nr:protein of unknown function [Bradyrhizobium vignae]